MDAPPELHREPEVAAEMAANAVLSYLHECGIEGHNDKSAWIKNVFDKVVAKELTQ